MFDREMITVCFYVYVKHTNTLDGQNVEFFNMNTCTCSGHLALKRLMLYFCVYSHRLTFRVAYLKFALQNLKASQTCHVCSLYV